MIKAPQKASLWWLFTSEAAPPENMVVVFAGGAHFLSPPFC